MIKIVSFKICPFVQRVTAMLEAKNTPYEIDYISLSDKPDWFLKLSPTGQVPLLVTEGGVALFESDAIVEYIDEVTEPLIRDQSAEDRALQRAWSYQASKHYLVQCSAMQSSDRGTYDTRMAKLRAAFGRVEAVLTEGPFFHGKTVGNVDMAWLPLLHRAHLVTEHSGYEVLRAFPKVKAWQQAVMQTGIPKKSVPEDFNSRFSDFYLGEHSWLGRGAPLDETCSPKAASGGGCCG